MSGLPQKQANRVSAIITDEAHLKVDAQSLQASEDRDVADRGAESPSGAS